MYTGTTEKWIYHVDSTVRISKINTDIRKTNLLGISYPESYVVKCNERANLRLKSIKMHHFRNKNGKSLLKVLDMHVWW